MGKQLESLPGLIIVLIPTAVFSHENAARKRRKNRGILRSISVTLPGTWYGLPLELSECEEGDFLLGIRIRIRLYHKGGFAAAGRRPPWLRECP